MSEEIKKEQPSQEKRMFSENRGRFILIDGVKSFFFDFPVQNTLEENYAAICFFKEQVWKVLEEQAKNEKEKKAKEEVKK